MNNSLEQKIDIVITWVDGDDPVLNTKRQKYISSSIAKNATTSTRFANNYELYFCLASIFQYCNFYNKIYIVTDKQIPPDLDEFYKQGICAKDTIQIIDHTQIFKGFEEYLPTFNSLSIETLIWNIDALTDKFIYFNDDFFINSPINIDHYFSNHNIILYGQWKNCFLLKLKNNIRKFINELLKKNTSAKFNVSQMIGAEIVGYKKYFHLEHQPHFLYKHIFKDYSENHKDIITQQIQYKFRNINQFFPISLHNHLCIQQDIAILKSKPSIAYLKPKGDINKFITDITNTYINFGCIQSLDEMDDKMRKQVFYVMTKKFEKFIPSKILYKMI